MTDGTVAEFPRQLQAMACALVGAGEGLAHTTVKYKVTPGEIFWRTPPTGLLDSKSGHSENKTMFGPT